MASLTDKVVTQLSEDIRTGSYRPGEKLPTEVALIEHFAVSRSVIREAVSRLQAGGLVETRHGIGTFVLGPGPASPLQVGSPDVADKDDVLAILAFRIDLEAGAAALAAGKRTDDDLRRIRRTLQRFEDEVKQRSSDVVTHDVEFHLSIAQASGNRYFHHVQGQLGRSISPRTRLGLADLAELDGGSTFEQVLREHRAIYAAIERQDAEDARAAMRVHLSNSRERLLRALRNAGAASPPRPHHALPIG